LKKQAKKEKGMADHKSKPAGKGKKRSVKPVKEEPENPSEANLVSIKPETRIQETDHMEVHHHPQLHHQRKPRKEYLLEFLMIFLAVTLGFLPKM
jgi:hypothetical protein